MGSTQTKIEFTKQKRKERAPPQKKNKKKTKKNSSPPSDRIRQTAAVSVERPASQWASSKWGPLLVTGFDSVDWIIRRPIIDRIDRARWHWIARNFDAAVRAILRWLFLFYGFIVFFFVVVDSEFSPLFFSFFHHHHHHHPLQAVRRPRGKKNRVRRARPEFICPAVGPAIFPVSSFFFLFS